MSALAPNHACARAPTHWRASCEAQSLALILGLSILALAWLLPGHDVPWWMFKQEALAALAGLLLCWAAVEKAPRVAWPISAWVCLSTAVAPWLQFGAGQIRFLTDALLSSAYLVALALAICAGATLVSGPRREQLLDGFVASCVAAAIVSSGLALCQWLQLPVLGIWLEELRGGRPYANLAQPNHLSSLLALGVAGVLRWYEARRIGPWAAALALLWMGWGIVMTQSRTGWLFVGMVTSAWCLLRRQAALRTPGWAVVAAVACFVTLVLLHGPLQVLWAQGDTGAAAAVRTSAGPRPLMWRVLAEAALQAPWFGHGWNQVVHAFYDTAGRMPASGTLPMHSHSLPLDLIIYNGILVGMFLFGALTWWVVRMLRRCRDAHAWCLAMALLALLAHALVEYPLHFFYFLLPAGLLVGALEVMTTPSGLRIPTASRVTLWAPALLMAGLLTWLGTEYLRAEEALRQLRFATARVGITMADLRSPDLQLLDGWKSYHDASTLKLVAGMPAAEMALIRDTTRRFPYPAALYRYAHALTLNEQVTESRQVLQLVCKGYRPHVQVALRESWRELQARDPAVHGVEFPDCTE